MENKGYANSCCTDAGVFGRFADATWQEGDSCAAVVAGKRVSGTACYSAAAAEGARFRIESIFALAHCAALGGGRPGLIGSREDRVAAPKRSARPMLRIVVS